MDSTASFGADAPLIDPRQDRFRRAPFAQRIAHTLSARTDTASLVVALYGAWGEGKTTALHFIQSYLSQDPNVVCFFFNPWRYPDEPTLLRNFFDTLASHVGRSIQTKGEDLAGKIRDFAKKVPAISLGGFGLPSGDVAAAADAIASIDLDEAKERIDGVLSESGKRIVVLLDDLDRLEPEEVHAVLRLVKLSVDFKNTVYVMAFDEAVVASALTARYGVGSIEGRRFLEKIVQVPLHLPHAHPGVLRKLCLEGVQRAIEQSGYTLSRDEVNRFVRHFDAGIEPVLQTPRAAKRYANALEFALPMLQGEANVVDVLLVEGLRVFFPTVYDAVRRNPDLFLGAEYDLAVGKGREEERERDARMLDEIMAPLSASSRKGAESLLMALFPRLGRLRDRQHYSSEWDDRWTTEKRVCSRSYFGRYFAYAIPEKDVSDKVIAEIVKVVAEGKATEGQGALLALLTPNNADQVVQKVNAEVASLGAASIPSMVQALAGIGDRLPEVQEFFDNGGPFMRAAILIRKLIARLPEGDERIGVAENVVGVWADFGFSIECYRWLRNKKDAEEENLFTKTEEMGLRSAALSRIKRYTSEHAVWDHTKAAFLLYIWGTLAPKDELKSHLSAALLKAPGDIGRLLAMFSSTPTDMSTGAVLPPEMSKDQFDQLVGYLPIESIHDAIEATYSAYLTAKKKPTGLSDEMADEVGLARRFCRHMKASESKSPGEGAVQDDTEAPAEVLNS